jgi:hypothetical protein
LFNGNLNNTNTIWLLPNSGSSNFSSPSTSGIIIGGKKLVDANTAYRAKVRIGFGSTKNTALDTQAGQADPEVTVDDTEKMGYFGLNLGFGLEKRVGSTRVVGVYGAMANIGFGSSKTKYEYGNALSTTNQSHSSSFDQTAGLTESKNGSSFSFGLSAFAGVEWFCAPKISLSGEYAWGLALSTRGFGESTTESWDPANNTVVTTVSSDCTGKRSDFSLDTSVSGASIGVNFYFQ